jgi:hypothetical protein
MQAREHAAATAQAKDLALPMVIWGVTEQAKQAKEKASGR